MLILMRRNGEAIRIGDEIRFTVLGVAGGQVRVGIDAPRSIIVDREEVYERRRSGKWTQQKPAPRDA